MVYGSEVVGGYFDYDDDNNKNLKSPKTGVP